MCCTGCGKWWSEMSSSKRLSVAMERREILGGIFYLPVQFLLLGEILTALWGVLGLGDPAEHLALFNGAFFLANFVCCITLYRHFLLRSLAQIRRRFWGFVQAVVLGVVLYEAVSYGLRLLLRWLDPGFTLPNDESIAAMIRENRAIMLAGTVFLAPLAEECVFRGLVFQGLHRRSRPAAYVASMLLFSLVHVVGYWDFLSPLRLLESVIVYLPAGFALAWSYEKADTIFAPIVMHSVINAISFYFL